MESLVWCLAVVATQLPLASIATTPVSATVPVAGAGLQVDGRESGEMVAASKENGVKDANVSDNNDTDHPRVEAPTRLRVEHRRSGEVPCLDTSTPRFSWDVPSAGRGSVQVSYRLTVSLGIEVGGATGHGATDGNGDALWDSGTVTSNSSVLVEYGGSPLPSHSIIQW
jgi:hypothetical protein